MSLQNEIGRLVRSFEFLVSTRIEFGDGISRRAAEAVAEYNGRKIMVVTDPGLIKVGIADRIIGDLGRAGLEAAVFDEVEDNPSTVTIDRAAKIAAGQGIEVIVAVGGGGRILDYEGLDRVPDSAAPLIAIPATAGTGSKVTMWSVITDPERRIKTAVGSRYIAPRIALVDPGLTVSLPPALTAATGIDALTHAVEAYTARCANPISDALALYAVELIGVHLENAVGNGANAEARSGMMLGSLLAGMAFGNSDTAAVHSMAEAMGGMFNISHGVANAICLPYVMGYNLPVVAKRTARIGSAPGLDGDGTVTPRQRARQTVEFVDRLVVRLGIQKLKDTGIPREDLPALAEKAFHNLGTPDNPRDIDEAGFERLFVMAFDALDPVEAA